MPTQWLQEPAILFSPRGKKFTVNLHRHQKGFPFDDPWGIGARRAWARVKTRGLTVAYLGVGAGAEVVQALLNGQSPARMLLNDIVEENLEVCRANVSDALARRQDYPDTLFDLRPAEQALSESGKLFHLITGCLPQVPDFGRPNMEQIAHVYPVGDYPQMSEWGLGLLHAVLTAARNCLTEDGKISLIISGRIPWEATERLFLANGFRYPEIAYQFMVRHHLGTPLDYLEDHQGVSLFADLGGSVTISPTEAETERLRVVEEGADPEELYVFHWVYLVEASPV